MKDNNQSESSPPEVAFYYPGHLWFNSDWVKNLLLFFDGIALLIPNYKKQEPEIIDPVIAIPLKEHGLLYNLEAETIVDKAATEKLAAAMTDVIVSGALDPLSKETTQFNELSYSRLGGFGDPGLANMIFEELKARNLAHESEDGVSIPMHPMVRALVLVLLSQILRQQGVLINLDLCPATDQQQLVDALTELLSLNNNTSTGNVVSFDLETVGVDLTTIPMDEVLSFRKEYLGEHRRYSRAVKKFVNELSLMEAKERDEAFNNRQEELVEIANDLKTISRKAWRRPASFALSIAGAAWTLKSGNPIGAILSAGSTLLGKKSPDEAQTGAYSYLFRARQQFY